MKALDLALAVYRITKKFPEGEFLIGQMRKTANQILAELISGHKKAAAVQIKIILNFFKIAQEQNWIKEVNFVILKREYQSLLDEVLAGKKSTNKKRKLEGLNKRQKTILEHADNLGKFQMKDITKIFPGLNSRTLRRDLDQLVSSGHLSKEGQGRWTFYQTL